MQSFLYLFISVNCSTLFQAVPPPVIRSTKLYIQRQVLSNQYCSLLLSWMRWITASSSIGLTIPDAICTVLCSWWRAEEPPETCRAIYRNKQIEKTLHLVGCSLEKTPWLGILARARLNFCRSEHSNISVMASCPLVNSYRCTSMLTVKGF